MNAPVTQDEFSALIQPAPGNLEVALDLAERGFAVFPVRFDSTDDQWKPIAGCYELATTEPATIRRWWRQRPDSRVGLPAGERNGITVLDLDCKNGKDGTASLAALGFPDLSALSPFRVRTPSGGFHLYFRYDERLKNSAGKIGDGIDVRNNRGFVVAPGSLKGAERYEVLAGRLGVDALPAFPEALVPQAREDLQPVQPLSQAAPNQIEWAKLELGEHAAALRSLAEGSRNDQLNSLAMWAGGAAAHGALTRDEAEAALVGAALAAGLKRREASKTFNSGFAAGLKQPLSGMPAPISDDDFDDLDDDGEDDNDLVSRLLFLSPGQCAAAPSRGYIIKGLLAPGDVACIYGAPGAGKSLISPHLGYAVAQGRQAFGMRTLQGSVFYVAAEDPQGMRGRVSALRRRHGEGEGFTLVEGVSDLLSKGSLDFKALRRAVEKQQPTLIFVDTLAMAFPGLEENSAEGMGRVVAAARKLAGLGPAVVLIHHDTKAGTPTPRGHSLLNGALDVALQLFPRDEMGIVRGKLTKNRNGSCDRNIAFRIATETLGYDSDGDAETSALVDELDPSPFHQRPKLTPSERAALSLLVKLQDRVKGNQVHEDEWRQACIDSRTVSAADDRESRRKATKRAFEGLTRKRAIVAVDKMVAAIDSTGHFAPDDCDFAGDSLDDPLA